MIGTLRFWHVVGKGTHIKLPGGVPNAYFSEHACMYACMNTSLIALVFPIL